ncbi:MAG: hypothetical protein ABI162_01060 [Luteolibacter sp.]
MADPTKPKSGGGCLSKLIFLILLIGALGLGTALFFITQPQNLSDLGGYGPAAKTAPVREMKVVLKNAIDRGFPVTLTEADINNWLGRTLSTKQGGLLASQISLERVWVRLEDGVAEVIMERKIMGRPFTVSMFLQVEKFESAKGVTTQVKLDGGPFHKDFPVPPRGGRFGKLVVPQGFLILVMPAYEKLAGLFAEEKRLGLEEMSRAKIEKGRIILDPRPPESGDPLLPQTF